MPRSRHAMQGMTTSSAYLLKPNDVGMAEHAMIQDLALYILVHLRMRYLVDPSLPSSVDNIPCHPVR